MYESKFICVYIYLHIYIYAAHGAAWKWLHGKIFIYAGGRLMGLHSEAKQLRHDVFLNAGRDKYRCHSPANTRGFALPCTLGPVSFGVSSSSGNEILPPCPKSKLVAEEKISTALHSCNDLARYSPRSTSFCEMVRPRRWIAALTLQEFHGNNVARLESFFCWPAKEVPK